MLNVDQIEEWLGQEGIEDRHERGDVLHRGRRLHALHPLPGQLLLLGGAAGAQVDGLPAERRREEA